MVPMVLVTAFRVSDLRACSSPSIVTPRDAADQKGNLSGFVYWQLGPLTAKIRQSSGSPVTHSNHQSW
jgi:hypothetical protein